MKSITVYTHGAYTDGLRFLAIDVGF
jgi:hypothetical protein